MFCTNCGNQLPDGTRFCIHCGAPQEAAPMVEPPVIPVEQPVVAAEEPAAVMEETPVAAMEEPIAQSSLAEDSFINAVAAEEATYELPFMTTPAYEPPVRTPAPKKKKTGVIIAIVLILVLLAGAAVGVYFYLDHKNSTAYDDAMALLEDGKIGEALTAFEDLGDYEDAPDMVKDLKDYQKAQKLLEEHKYDEALKIFKDLGKFHDSKTYAESGVDYHKAKYILACADKANPAALSLVDGTESDDDSYVAHQLYSGAAAIFEELGDYEDSANLASESWLGVALIELDWGNSETALGIQERLNDDHADALQAQLEDRSADATILTDLETALVIWMDDEDAYTIAEETEKTYTHLELYEDLYFLDPRLEELYWDFMESLEDQMDAVGSDGYVEDWVSLYEACADMYYVCDCLNEEYGFLDGSDLYDAFIGYYETAAKYPGIEASLNEQFTNVTAPWSDENDYYYVPYTNDTGSDITLHIYVDFYLGETYLETGEVMDISVPAGETVEIPLIPETLDDNDWDGWTVTWWFDVA